MKNKLFFMQLCIIFSLPLSTFSEENTNATTASVNMESVLKVGRENQELSASSQDKIDATERQTDKIVNEWKAVSKQVEGLRVYNEQKRIQIKAQLELIDRKSVV